ncbi:MAG: SIMPL domain-containing protein, partial [Acetobacteraceae bacterium]
TRTVSLFGRAIGPHRTRSMGTRRVRWEPDAFGTPSRSARWEPFDGNPDPASGHRAPARLLSALVLAIGLLAAAPIARAATILQLSASATVMVTPDELEARLSAAATGATAALAQGAVNAMMGEALAAARKVAKVDVSTGAYSVWHVSEPHPKWRASEALVLVSRDGPALLGLVGALQTQGLAVSELSWRLAASTEAAAREKAEVEAIAKLKARAEAVAKLLGLRFSGFREVWLNPPTVPPVRPMAMAAARAMPAPQAVAALAAVRATVKAEAALKASAPP